MIREYLEKTKQEFNEKKVSIDKEILLCENQLKENNKIMEILDDANDPNFEAFAPRKNHTFNQKKMMELKKEHREVESRLSNLQDQKSEIEYKIAEISSVIKVTKENINDCLFESDSYDSRIALLNSVETERQRIARDLHDSTTQNLTALVHKIELCTKLLDVDTVRCKLELFSIGKSLREIIEDTRGIIYDLRPMSFDDIGFDVTVERTLEKFSRLCNIKCNYHVEGIPYLVDSVVQITLLRVIQEACNNAYKHAHASKLDVIIYFQNKKMILKIDDDGIGFDLNSKPDSSRDDNSGFGLSMMKERVYLLSGRIKINTSPGNGCSIVVTIPRSKEDK